MINPVADSPQRGSRWWLDLPVRGLRRLFSSGALKSEVQCNKARELGARTPGSAEVPA